MKRTILIATLSALMTLPALGTAFARGPGGGPGMGRGKGHGCMGQAMKAANLTADQKTRLQTMREQMKERNAPLRAELQAKREELRALWQAPNPDRNAILAKQDEMDRIRRNLRTAGIDHRFAVMGVLTPEQRAKVQQELGTCEARGGGRGGKGRHGRGGGGGMGPGFGGGF